MTPFIVPKDYAFGAILQLIQEAFAEQSGKVNPPSSMNHLTVADVKSHAVNDAILAIESGGVLVACIFTTQQNNEIYLSKLSVALSARGKGHAKTLIESAGAFAQQRGILKLTLISRVELTENHAFFGHLGFEKTRESRHPGYDRPTEIHFERRL